MGMVPPGLAVEKVEPPGIAEPEEPVPEELSELPKPGRPEAADPRDRDMMSCCWACAIVNVPSVIAPSASAKVLVIANLIAVAGTSPESSRVGRCLACSKAVAAPRSSPETLQKR
jgi:hypothetical protein